MTVINAILEAEEIARTCKAAIFDLDDTLYLEKSYVKSGYKAVATAFPQIKNMQEKLWTAFLRGGKAIDEVLQSENAFTQENKEKCLQVYRFHTPTIALYDGVEDMLKSLKKSGVKLGLITDGRSEGQRAKIKALGIEKLFDSIVITDELGGVEYRKPNEKAFVFTCERLGVAFADAVYIGDNLKKDFIAPEKLGMKSCYFKNPDGLYTE